MAASGLILVHVVLAVTSLVRENPTIDEVAHLPAGITYWQTGTFRLYAQNPPLVKLAAALPVVLAKPEMARIYERPSWRSVPPVQASIAHEFAVDNAPRYFELFRRARLVIPLFSVLGALVVFAWSRALWGNGGGVLSLALWCLCPNILAHARLVTTDVGATSLGVLATWLFWRYAKAPTRGRAVLAGLALGLAVLAKFSNLLLFGVWPLIWAACWLAAGAEARWSRLRRGVRHGLIVVGVALLAINAGYLFEGTGKPLGSYEFASGTLTRPRPPGTRVPASGNELLNLAWRFRVNRFRDTLLGALPAPLPAPFLNGFDLQKLDAEGIPKRFVDPDAPEGETTGYPVYLDGELRSQGWRSYYLRTLLYKVPEGTWFLGLLALGALVTSRRGRASWADEVAVLAVPAAVLVAMTFGTDINLGLRYILPAFPYVYVAMGRLAPWATGLVGIDRGVGRGAIAAGLIGLAAATAAIHPHYLSYFNELSGGPANGSEHLIDSNLDWGQDLVNLRDWLKANAPGERVGLAYFGQINPNVLNARGEGFDWFLAPAPPGALRPLQPAERLDGMPDRFGPGLYAVSASFVRGLPYAIYDPSMRVANLYPGWDSRGTAVPAYTYFRELTPVAKVGYSIFVYRVTPGDAARFAGLWPPAASAPASAPAGPR
jgi:4-amino-4-deoxy-L-arabinose transferase-like glycosyltransferase